MDLDGKVVMVTGGGSGIGAAVARAFAAAGAAVAVVDIDERAAAAVAGGLARGVALTADVADSTAVDAVVAEAVADLGRLDVLVNNAGIIGRSEAERVMPRMEAQLGEMLSGGITSHLDATVSITDAEWHRMLATHLDGTFYCTRAALRIMVPQGGGVIVNMASICGIAGCAGMPHYSAAKGGILALTRAVAKEVAHLGVRVNAIAPGYVETPLLDPVPPVLRQGIVMQTPLGRMGTPEEIASVAVFLATDEAAFFVGETLSPNGGYVTT